MVSQVGDFELTDVEVAFLRGVFAARGIATPTEQEFRDAMQLLELHSMQRTSEPNQILTISPIRTWMAHCDG
jgi:hypothetical protein